MPRLQHAATLTDWVAIGISSVSLIIAFLSLYFAYLRRGKVQSSIENWRWTDVSDDLTTCKMRFLAVFENLTRRDWVISTLFFDRADLVPAKNAKRSSNGPPRYEAGYTTTSSSLISADKTDPTDRSPITVPPGKTVSREFEVQIPFMPLAFWVVPLPPIRSKAASNRVQFHPAMQVIPFLVRRDDPESRKLAAKYLIIYPIDRPPLRWYGLTASDIPEEEIARRANEKLLTELKRDLNL